MGQPARALVGSRSVEEVLEENRRAVDAIVARNEGRQLADLLREAQDDLARQLRKAHRRGLDKPWTSTQMMATRATIRDAVRHVYARMMGQLHVGADQLGKRAISDTVKVLKAGERAFVGVTPILALDQALRFDHVLHGVKSTLLRQYPTSVDRYGTRMLGEVEKQMQLGIITGQTTGQMIDRLVGHGGPKGPRVSIAARVLPNGAVERIVETEAPEGLFVQRRYWAERIVRTELLNSYAVGTQASIEEEQATDFPDLKRIILAHFDRVTAPDSVYVHGQIRGVREYFIDGAGRSYLHPPGRPNDRERVTPWREGWGKPTGTLAPRPEAERQKAAVEAGGAASKGGPLPATRSPQRAPSWPA